MSFKNKNKIVKLSISIVSATFIWAYVANVSNPIQEKVFKSVPVELKNIDSLQKKNLALKPNQLDDIDITIKGRYNDIVSLNKGNLLVEIDFKELDLKEGSNKISINADVTKKNVDIVLEQSNLNKDIEISNLIKKEFSITPNIEGIPAESYKVGTPTIKDNTVIVSGTKESLRDIAMISANINVSNESTNISKEAYLVAIDKNGEEMKNVNISKQMVQAEVPIYFTKKVPIILQATNIQKEIQNITISNPEIWIGGNKEILDNIKELKSKRIDLSQYTSEFTTNIELEKPVGVRVLDDISDLNIKGLLE